MRHFFRLLILLCCVGTSFSATGAATSCAKCDCDHWPWKDSCSSCCSLKAFNNSSSSELHYFLGLNDPLSQQIADLKRNKGQFSSPEEFHYSLTPQQFTQFTDKLKNAPSAKRQYLLAPPDEKRSMQNDMHQAHQPATATKPSS